MRDQQDVEEPKTAAAHVVSVRVLDVVVAAAHHLEELDLVAHSLLFCCF